MVDINKAYEKRYNVQFVTTPYDLGFGRTTLQQARIRKLDNLLLMNISGISTGQFYFMNDKDELIIIPAIYIVSMFPNAR